MSPYIDEFSVLQTRLVIRGERFGPLGIDVAGLFGDDNFFFVFGSFKLLSVGGGPRMRELDKVLFNHVLHDGR